MNRPGKWLIGAAGALALVMAVDVAASLVVKSQRVSRALTARLEATFGRPVQVGQFSFGLWGGPRIEADSVTVGEDPRFGHEYFLRAQQVSATLRWRSLLRGRLAFGTFSFSQPSLNVVTVGGRWNLADWLPPANRGRPGGAGGRSRTPQLYRIEIDGGRMDFKRGSEKLPFALVNVSGRVDERGPGRWTISLEAQPLRAAVTLQDAGTLRLAGEVGGTSTRLRPARLNLSWRDASLSDVLRLVTGSDYGVRGRQSLELSANSTGGDWSFELDAHAVGVHRWDLVSQPGNPGINVRLAGSWSPGEGKLKLTGGRIEGPGSLVAVSGEADWSVAPYSGPGAEARDRQVQLHFNSDGIGMQDLLAWYRSFHAGISGSLHAAGWLQGSMDLAGWPPHIVDGTVAGDGLRIEGGRLTAPVRLASAKVDVSEKEATLQLPRIDFGRKVGVFQMAGRARNDRTWTYRLAASGATPEIGVLVRAVEALGARPLGYWNEFSGGGDVQLDWRGRLRPFDRHARASLNFHDAVWSEPSLPARVRLARAHAEIADGHLRFDVQRAETMGTTWSGWLERRQAEGPWGFDLKAGKLDARALAARLRPEPQRPGLLERIFGFGHAAGLPASWLASLDAAGRLEVNQLKIDPLAVEQVEGSLSIHEGMLELSRARARFSGGEARGSFRFSVAKRAPAWHLAAQMRNVELAGISRAVGGAAGRFSGVASGSLDLDARGATTATLRDTLRGSARVSVRHARDSHIDWVATLEAGHAMAGRSAFQNATARLELAGGKVTLQDLLLVGAQGRLEATGGIDFTRGGALTVEARFLPHEARARQGSPSRARTFQVTGSAEEPRIRLRLPTDLPSGPPPRH
jgi:hypothetical protein